MLPKLPRSFKKTVDFGKTHHFWGEGKKHKPPKDIFCSLFHPFCCFLESLTFLYLVHPFSLHIVNMKKERIGYWLTTNQATTCISTTTRPSCQLGTFQIAFTNLAAVNPSATAMKHPKKIRLVDRLQSYGSRFKIIKNRLEFHFFYHLHHFGFLRA